MAQEARARTDTTKGVGEMTASLDDHYGVAYGLVKDAIYDWLISERDWYYEEEGLEGEYDLKLLQDIIRDIAFNVGS